MTIQISPSARAWLEGFLRERFGVTPPLSLGQAPGGRSNRNTHVVATDADGQRIGLKYVSGHYSDPETREHLLPTENIYIAGQLSKVLDTPTHIEAEMFGPIPGLGPLAEVRAVARQWHGESFNRANMGSVKEELPGFLRQYGEWAAFGLLFSLADGKIEHWTWDEMEKTVGRCDLELLFFERGKVSDYTAPLRALGVQSSIASGRGAEYEAFVSGLTSMVEKFHARRVRVDDLLSGFDNHAGTFLSTHHWAALAPDDFPERVISRLG